MTDYRFPSPGVDARFPGGGVDNYFDNGGRFVGGKDLRFEAPGIGRPSWLVPGPDGALPVQVSAWSDNAGYVGGQVYGSAAAYLAAAGGTFSRASDGWRRDADRVWRKSGPNVLRLHHDAAGKPLGALLEGQRTFSLWPSRDLTNANWTKRGTCMVTQDMGVLRPDGTLGAMRIDGLGNGGADDIYRSVAGGPASQNIAPSVMLLRLSTSGLVTLSNPYGNALGRWRVNLALLPDAWELVTRTHPAITVLNEFSTSAGGGYGFQFSTDDGSPLALYADFIDIELANTLWPSSPMDPSTGAVTRLADALSYPAATPSEFTIVVDAITAPGLDAAQVLFHWDDGTTNNRLRLYHDLGTDKMVLLTTIAGSSTWYPLTDAVIGQSARAKIALAVKAGSIAASANGAAVKTWTPISPIPAGMTTYREGANQVALEQWFHTIARLTRYAKAYAAAELPAMSALS